MKINNSLSEKLKLLEIPLESISSLNLDKSLKRLLDEGFYLDTDIDCVFFKQRRREDISNLLDDLQDLTGVECFINDVSIDDYVETIPEMLIQGIAFASQLAKKLRGFNGQFSTILTYNAESNSSTVRFHKNREGESWLSGDLDSYGDGILVIESGIDID